MGKAIHKEAIIPAPVSEVWDAWTTTAGVESFFARKAKVELSIGGAFEMYFDPSQPEGLRGSEGCKVLSFLPEQMLSFSWNAPPHLPHVRKEYIWVVVMFEPSGEDRTKVTLTHLGWKEGEEWDRSYEYFQRAWSVVLFWLEHRFRVGPVDWNHPPDPEAA